MSSADQLIGTCCRLIKHVASGTGGRASGRARSQRRTTADKIRNAERRKGAPISPLLSNLYMRRFVLAWKVLGYELRFQASVVNYADDLVICCRPERPAAMDAIRTSFERLGLTVNEEKTRLVSGSTRIVRLSGLHLWSLLLVKDGTLVCGPTCRRREAVQAVCSQRIHEVTNRAVVLAGARGTSRPYSTRSCRVGANYF